MTPGPTRVRENVRLARSLECTNPDIDLEFVEYYKNTCDLISELLHTKNTAYILDGEGILGLEAAIASLTETGDKVLILDNGLYGRGFGDFVTMYGGTPVYFTTSYTRSIEPDELEDYLKDNHDFKYATLVHCDTPSGMLNPVETLSRILHKHGIMTVVDSVSAMFGEPLDVDAGCIDIVCGGSQKVVSAPPGLSFVTVSKEALDTMNNRKTPIASFYANILAFVNYYKDKWFPYTMPISDIYGLNVALNNIKNDPDIYARHARCADMVRAFVRDNGLSFYGENGYSNTVTAIRVPEGYTSGKILSDMLEKYNIMIAGSFDDFAGQLIRIGHMGENAREEYVTETLDALKDVLGL
jgi:aspartate aminotransferase-like enzyme